MQIEPREPLQQIMVARYYSSSLGRFMAVDPGNDTVLEDPQSWNKYAYVRNNPIKNTDPTGEFLETAFDVAMAVVSVTQAIQNPTGGNILGAALDVAAVIVPGVPAVGGRLVDAAQAGNKLVDAAKAADTAADAGKAAGAASDAGKAGGATLKPGPHAGEGVPTSGGRPTAAERAEVNKQGAESGCHTCGTKDPGTKSGNFVPDHQPPTALNPPGGQQTLHPHCKNCSNTQGGQVTATKKKESQ